MNAFDTLQNTLLQYPTELRILVLFLVMFTASIGIIPATTSDLILFGAGLGVRAEWFSMVTTVVTCFLAIWLSEMVAFDLGHRFGETLFLKRFLIRFVGEKRLGKMKSGLEMSEDRLIRSLRFTPFFRPYLILCVAALGASRRRFHFINTLGLIVYVPIFLYAIASLAGLFDFGIGTVMVVLCGFLALSLLAK